MRADHLAEANARAVFVSSDGTTRHLRFEPAEPDGESLTLGDYAERAYLDYAISVVKGRALPDVSRRPEAGAAPHPVRDERDGPAPRRQAGQVGARGRRRARQVAPARRPVGLRRAGAHGAGLLAALSADRRPGQLRLARRRRRGGDALHRSAPDADRAPAARRNRPGHRRLRAELRRLDRGAEAAAGAPAVRAAERRVGHRGRPGHRNPVAQSARSGGGRGRDDPQSEDRATPN